jgi:HlyD family secretion protein
MKKFLQIFIIVVVIGGALYGITALMKKNSKPAAEYDTTTLSEETIVNKVIATGKVVPEDEVLIKPQISGIINKIYVEEGDKVRTGDLIAKIMVVPNEQSLVSARGRVKNAEISLTNAKTEFERNKKLADRGVVANQDFLNIKLRYEQALQELENARNDYQIIRIGSTGGSGGANTLIRATVSGTILEIPVEEGDQVIQANNFNEGTTISTIADMGRMIFEGKVDEAEVSKLSEDMPLTISLGALQNQQFDAKLKFVAPKGVEEQGAVQFTIKGDLVLNDTLYVRAGYSANASIVVDQKDSVLAVREALLQFDRQTQEPYVEVLVSENTFERRNVELGISDGIFAEVLSGITSEDKIKIWNKTEPLPGTEEEGDDSEDSED